LLPLHDPVCFLAKEHEQEPDKHDKDQIHQAIGKNVLAVLDVEFAELLHGGWMNDGAQKYASEA